MPNRLDISAECGEDCRVIFPEAVGGRAAEIGVGGGQPIAESKVADASRCELQDVTDDRKDSAVRSVELEQRQPDPAILDQGDDGIISGHGLHDAFRIIRFDAQERAGLRRINQVDAGEEALHDARFVGKISQ